MSSNGPIDLLAAGLVMNPNCSPKVRSLIRSGGAPSHWLDRLEHRAKPSGGPSQSAGGPAAVPHQPSTPGRAAVAISTRSRSRVLAGTPALSLRCGSMSCQAPRNRLAGRTLTTALTSRFSSRSSRGPGICPIRLRRHENVECCSSHRRAAASPRPRGHPEITVFPLHLSPSRRTELASPR